MIDWKKIVRLRVTKKLVDVCQSISGAAVFFFDQKNDIQHIFPSHQEALDIEFKPFVREFLKSLKQLNPGIVSNESKGLLFLGLPIRINGDYAGSIIIGGIRRTWEPPLDVPKSFVNVFNALPLCTNGQIELMKHLMEIIVDEIISFHQELSQKDKEIENLTKKLGLKYNFRNIVGRSPKMMDVLNILNMVIDTDSTVIIYGESGTGKEEVARAIHYNSHRRNNEFVVANCSAFSENLLESEMFGHVKGAFTGAIEDKKGLFQVADKGTLFLDEIGDMSLALQSKLLRVLQNGEFLKVGGTKPIRVDTRIVVATNKDLEGMIKEGKFRDDLYYRLNVVKIVLPPLRERKEDIPLLIEHILEEQCKKHNTPLKTIGKGTLEALMEYDWPGNIRELENELEKAVIFTKKDSIDIDSLSPEILGKEKEMLEFAKVKNLKETKKEIYEKIEKEIIEKGLIETDWNKTKLAGLLNISRGDLMRKIKRYGLDRRSK